MKITNIKELRDQLTKISNPTEFEDIADALFNNFEIRKGNYSYEFVEIEFYLYNANHKDAITYSRTCKAGQWFFHDSGVDISFKSEKAENEEGFVGGGILIRSIKKNGNELICGPINCMSELFDQFDALGEDTESVPSIKTCSSNHINPNDIGICKRFVNLDYKPENLNEKLSDKLKKWSYKDIDDMKNFINKQYRYYRKDVDWTAYKKYVAKPDDNYQPKGFEQ